MVVGDLQGANALEADIVYDLAASPAFEVDSLCFAARRSGLYRSLDAGANWEPAFTSLGLQAQLPALAVTVSPDFDADRTVLCGVPGGLLRSIDAGVNWQVAKLPDPPPVISALAFSPDFRRDGLSFAATLEDGVFRSSDRGGRWVSWNFGLLDLNVLCLAASEHYEQDETLLAGADSGLFRSTNGGRAWREVDFPIDYAPVISLAISPGENQAGKIFVGTEAHGVFYSADAGDSWRQMDPQLADHPVNAILCDVSNGRLDLLVVSGPGLFLSRDGGATWSSLELNSLTFGESITACIAPQGLAKGALVLLGLADGAVEKLLI
jgi:photosystem II stability/assembly factor-like uncharacterized protein